jgi:hypothetical protein
MEIHKPKAAHSLREFAIEIGTIICGILIALGLEQAVERAHVDREVSETREALREEIAQNAGWALASEAEYRCLDVASDQWIAWAKGGKRPVRAGVLWRIPNSAVWDASKSGPVMHMPVAERLRFAAYYEHVANFRDNLSVIKGTAGEMSGYLGLDSLAPGEDRALIREVNRVRGYFVANAVDAGDLVRDARAMGVKPSAIDAGSKAIVVTECQAVGMPAPNLNDPNRSLTNLDWYVRRNAGAGK